MVVRIFINDSVTFNLAISVLNFSHITTAEV